MKTFVASLFVLVAMTSIAFATEADNKPLEERVHEADFIAIGVVTKVTMHDEKGRESRDPKLRTGPGLKNEIRIYVRFDQANSLKSCKNAPREAIIPEWQMWHSNLEVMQSLVGQSYIFLLKTDPVRFVYVSGAMLPLSERPKIESILKQQSSK